MSFDNQHYISKCLTKPWEENGRKLFYFDFSSKTIADEKSEILFAGNNLWEKHFEKRFSSLFERMFEHIRSVVTNGSGEAYIREIHWKAVYALLAIHIQRGVHALENPQKNEFSLLENSKFFQVMSLFAQKYQAIRIPCPHHYLAFPESTIYPLPVKVGTDWHVGYAISVSPNYAIGYVPYGWSKEEMKKVTQLFLSGLSVGIGNYARRVVLSPELVQLKEKEFLIEKMIASRNSAEELLRMVLSKDKAEQRRWEISVDIIWNAFVNGQMNR